MGELEAHDFSSQNNEFGFRLGLTFSHGGLSLYVMYDGNVNSFEVTI